MKTRLTFELIADSNHPSKIFTMRYVVLSGKFSWVFDSLNSDRIAYRLARRAHTDLNQRLNRIY